METERKKADFFTCLKTTLFIYYQQPSPDKHAAYKFGRNAVIGFASSLVSDTVSNSLRVIKTTRQTFSEPIRYISLYYKRSLVSIASLTLLVNF